MAKDDVKIKIGIEANDQTKKALDGVQKSVNKAQKNASKLSKTFQNVTKSATDLRKVVDKSASAISNVTSSVFSLQSAIVGAVSSYVVGTVVEAANRQESAINSVAVAMARAGEFSQEALKDMEAFASQLQVVTGIGDEAALEMVSFAKSMGATNEQAKELTRAAIELSAATGKGTDESIAQLSKTLGGFAGELGEVNPAIKELTKEQLQAGDAAKILLAQYGGTAAANLNTFAGALTATSGAFGDFLEQIGFLLTRNKAVVTFVQTFKSLFEDLGGLIGDSQGDLAGFVKSLVVGLTGGLQIVVGAIQFIKPAFEEAIISALEFAKTATDLGILSVVVEGLRDGILSVAQGFLVLQNAAAAVQGIAAFVTGDTDKLKKLNEEVDAARIKMGELQNIKDTPIQINTGEISKKIDEFKASAKSVGGVADKALSVIGTGLDKLQKKLDKLGDDVVIDPKINLKNAEKASKDIAKKLAADIKSAFNSLEKELDKIGKSQLDLIKEEKKARLDLIKQAAAAGEISGKRAAELTGKAEADATNKVATIREANNKKILDKLKAGLAAVTDIAKQGFELVFNSAKDILSGRFISELDSFVTGLINIPTQMNESLDNLSIAVSDESIDQFLSGFDRFVDRLPNVLIKVFDKLPVILDKFIQAFPKIIDALVKAFPKIVDAIVDALPKLIDAILEAIPKIIEALGKALPKIISQLGKAIEQIFQKLPEIFESIFAQLPAILESILQALPGIILSILDALPKIIVALVDAIPELIETLANNIGPIIQALVEGLTDGASDIALGLVNSLLFEGGLERIIGAIARGIVKAIEGAFVGTARSLGRAITTAFNFFIDKLTNWEWDFDKLFETPGWVQELIDLFSGKKIKDALSGDGSTGSKIATVLTGGLSNAAGFATGGQVPAGFPNDSFPARLSSGELVIPPGDTQRLNSFLDQQSNGSGTEALLGQIVGLLQQPMQVKSEATLDGDKFADIILNLNRTNARLT